MSFPSKCFRITEVLNPRTVEYSGGVGCVLTCITEDGSSLEFWGLLDSDEEMWNIEEIIKFKNMLPITVGCHYTSTNYRHHPTKINWDDEIEIIDEIGDQTN